MSKRSFTVALLVDDHLKRTRLGTPSYISRLHLRQSCRLFNENLPPMPKPLSKKAIQLFETLSTEWTVHKPIKYRSYNIILRSSRAGILVSQHYPRMMCRHFISSADMCEECFWKDKFPFFAGPPISTSLFYPIICLFISIVECFPGIRSYITNHSGTWGTLDEWSSVLVGLFGGCVAGLLYASIQDRRNQRKTRFMWNYVQYLKTR